MIMGWNKLQTRWRQQSFRHVAPIAVGLYELTLLGWLIWAGTQLGTLGNLSIFKHYPYIVTVILASLSIHVVVVGVLEFWLIRQKRFAVILLGAWFTLVAPVLLIMLFELTQFLVLVATIGSGLVALCLWRYYQVRFTDSQPTWGRHYEFDLKRTGIGMGVIAAIVIVAAITSNYLIAVPLAMLPMYLLWTGITNDSLMLGGLIVATAGTVGILLILFAWAGRSANWGDMGMGLAWWAVGGIIWWGMNRLMNHLSKRQSQLGHPLA